MDVKEIAIERDIIGRRSLKHETLIRI
jgi:hypothetical protein